MCTTNVQPLTPSTTFVDEIDQVFRGPVLGCVRGGQRLLDLDVVAAGRH
jgi:hypothetical protein